MSPEAQRIAIAEACGWRRKPEFDYVAHTDPVFPDVAVRNEMWGKDSGHLIPFSKVPNYPTDLNAMHESEINSGRIIGPSEWDKYCEQIRIKIGRDIEAAGGPGSVAGLMCLESAVHATAAQRAEAFLKTIGKWDALK